MTELHPQVLERDGKPSFVVLPDRDGDPIAMKISAFDHHIAEIDADTRHDAPVLGQVLIRRRELLLQFDRASDGVDRAGKLNQHSIAQ